MTQATKGVAGRSASGKCSAAQRDIGPDLGLPDQPPHERYITGEGDGVTLVTQF